MMPFYRYGNRDSKNSHGQSGTGRQGTRITPNSEPGYGQRQGLWSGELGSVRSANQEISGNGQALLVGGRKGRCRKAG